MLLYLLKFTLCSATLLLFYKLVLEREKMLRFNRFYLLSSLVLALILPLVSFQVTNEQAALFPAFNSIPLETVSPFVADTVYSATETATSNEIDWAELTSIIYLAVGGYLLLRFAQNLSTLLNRARHSEVVEYEDTKLVLLNQPALPHSFLNCIFLNKQEYLSRAIEPEILHHERAHVHQRHTLDLLFVELLRVIFWVNPVLYFYRQAIVLNHEFLADAEVLQIGRNPENYQYLLLRYSARPANSVLTSKFNYSFIKKRFVMMYKQTSRSRALLAQCAVLLLLFIAIFAFSDLTLAQVTPPPPPVERAPSKQSLEKAPPPPTIDFVYEFNGILAKYHDKSKPTFGREASVKDGERMKKLMDAMTPEQRESMNYTVMTNKPLPRVIPNEQDFEQYKQPAVYGIWINEKKVSNAELNKYKASDFSQVSVSKLYGKALNTGNHKYKYQVDMMTSPYYEKYLLEESKSPVRYFLYKINRAGIKK